jgi:general nucleoside transport system permease protein
MPQLTLRNIFRKIRFLRIPDISIPVLAVFTAFGCGAVLIWASGASVIEAYQGLFTGMCGTRRAVIETCIASTPYILTGLSVAVGFQCGLFNIGAEGQFYMGALCSVMIGFGLHDMPPWIHASAAILAGIAGGVVWGAIPGFLKARFGGHEVINTIMMNYIGINLSDLFVKKIIRDPSATVDRTPYIMETARLPQLLGPNYRLHAGSIIALAAVALLFWLLYKTRIGFEIRTVGTNPGAARYSGMRVGRTIVLVMAIAGGLAGLAGAGEVLGLKYSLSATFSRGYGYDAIAVAFLARSNPLGVLPAAFLWGGLRNGAGLMQIRSGISIDLVNIIQALVIVFIAADPIVRWIYRIAPHRRTITTFARGWGK